MKFLRLALLFLPLSLFANIGPQGFHEFAYNSIFVETGTFQGFGCKKALDAGFKEVRSIELLEHYYFARMEDIGKDPRVKLYLGDARTELSKAISDINEPVTFWLDGHMDPALPNGASNCPLVEELEQIAAHPVKTHTILIDDMHCANTVLFDFLSIDDLKEMIWKINPKYEIRFVPGGDRGEYPKNVLAATVPN